MYFISGDSFDSVIVHLMTGGSHFTVSARAAYEYSVWLRKLSPKTFFRLFTPLDYIIGDGPHLIFP